MNPSQLSVKGPDLNETLNRLFSEMDHIILGKNHQLKLVLVALLSEGHILIEDIPGVGKTTLVKLMAQALGLRTRRIQFTNDLLPSDILGTSIFDSSSKTFRFHPGPIFSEIVIADELNRATPKTQSACLQAMEERKVSIDGVTHELPKPFFLVATQNPREQIGTYSLPESQLDRFLMRIEIGFPDRKSENELLKGESRADLLDRLEPILNTTQLLDLQQQAKKIHVSDNLVRYVQDILDYSRSQSDRHYGLSPRAGLAIIAASRSWAFLDGRHMVLPEDVQAIGPSVIGHRLNRSEDSNFKSGLEFAREIFEKVSVD